MKTNILTDKELARRDVIEALNHGHITRSGAAQRLAITVRQLQILRKRYKMSGDQGLIDRRRFTKGNFSKPAPLKAQVIGLIKNDYAGMGPTEVCRKLVAECGVTIHIETVRQWMARAGISTARRSSYQISDVDTAVRTATPDAMTPERLVMQRRHCLPPRLFTERHVASLAEEPSVCRFSVVPEFALYRNQAADQERTTDESATTSDQHSSRTPSMAELDALFSEHGTSADALDEFAVNLAIQLMRKLGRPVTEAEIEAYIDQHEPDLQPLLRLIDIARDVETKRRKRMGKRLNFEQRQAILRLLRRNVRPADIARAFNISPGAIATYKRQLNVMDDADRPIHLT